jgi:hypothetical protein
MTRTQTPGAQQVELALDAIERARAGAMRQPVSVQRCLTLAELADTEAAWWAEVFESARLRVQWRAALAAREHALHTARVWRARAVHPRLSQSEPELHSAGVA